MASQNYSVVNFIHTAEIYDEEKVRAKDAANGGPAPS